MALSLGDQKNKRYVKITPTPVNRHGSRVVRVMGCGWLRAIWHSIRFLKNALAIPC